MNINYFTTKKLFKQKENKDRFMSPSPVEYQLSKRSFRDDKEFESHSVGTYNQKLKEIIKKEERESRLKMNLLEGSQENCFDFGYPSNNIAYDSIITHHNFRSIDEKAYKVLDAPGYSKNIYSHSIDANSKGLLAALIDGQIFLNSTSNGKTQKLVSNLQSINCLKFINRDDIVAIGTTEGHLALYDLNKETSVIIKQQHKAAITSIDATTGESILSIGNDMKARVFDIRTKQKSKSYEFYRSPMYTVKANPNNPFVFSTGESNGMLSIVDTRLDNPLMYRTEHGSGIRGLTWHANKRDILYSAGLSSGELKAINSLSFEHLCEHQLSFGVCDLLFSKMSNEVLVAQNNGGNSIEVRGATQLNKLAELKGHTKSILDLCHLKENDIISGSMDQSLRFWNLSTLQSNINSGNLVDNYKRLKHRNSPIYVR